MEGSLLPRLIIPSLSLFPQQVTLGMVHLAVVVAAVTFGPLCCVRSMSATVRTSASIQAVSTLTTATVTTGFPCGACLDRIYLSYHPNQFSNRMLTRCAAPPKHLIRKLKNKKLLQSSYGLQRTY